MIKIILQAGQNGPVTGTRLEDLSELVTDEKSTVWVDVIDPTKEEIARIGKRFEFHPLALEDVERGGQRPKIDQYDGFQFIVFYGLTTELDRCRSHEVNIFVGKHFMVTFHDSHLAVITETAERWHTNVGAMGNRGVGFLLYSLLDALVDGYFPVLDDIAERADTLEETIILQGQPSLQAEILQLRRELLMIRRVAGPERDVMNVLVRRDPPLFGRKELAYFQDVYDHLLRITDSVDIYRDMLSSVLDANLSMVSYTLNIVVKRLTSSSIILMSMTLVAGIYGMNFVFMPELDWRLGYPFALGLMVIIALIEYRLFKRIGWL
ncbi:MAG: magnesium/cobalt transporter CorA [Chloroflexota bacterium]|nr:magnesium/cobalt transporter CorA [Chloroflexia bacterium]MDQ3227054.1 magnesium/cobalt transporter CorA [Chloroflexota bacterium]